MTKFRLLNSYVFFDCDRRRVLHERYVSIVTLDWIEIIGKSKVQYLL